MSAWSTPTTALASADVTGGTPDEGTAPGTPVTGSVINYERVMSVHALTATLASISGGDGLAGVSLQGSLDGENWYSILGVSFPQGATPGVSLVAPVTTPAQYVQVVVQAFTQGGGVTPISASITDVLVIAQEVT